MRPGSAVWKQHLPPNDITALTSNCWSENPVAEYLETVSLVQAGQEVSHSDSRRRTRLQ